MNVEDQSTTPMQRIEGWVAEACICVMQLCGSERSERTEAEIVEALIFACLMTAVQCRKMPGGEGIYQKVMHNVKAEIARRKGQLS